MQRDKRKSRDATIRRLGYVDKPARRRVKRNASESTIASLSAKYASIPASVLESTDDYLGDIDQLTDAFCNLPAFQSLATDTLRPKRGIPERGSEGTDSPSGTSTMADVRGQFVERTASKASKASKAKLSESERLIANFKRAVNRAFYFDWRHVNWQRVEQARLACESE